MPFYKLDDNASLQIANQVFTPEITLVEEDKDSYAYPQYGWYWFENLEKAVEGLRLKITTGNDSVVKPIVNNRYITKLAFRNRFTNAEKLALYAAAENNLQMKIYLDDVNAATYIDLDRQDTIDNVKLLESIGLIAAGRASIILHTPVSNEERWIEK